MAGNSRLRLTGNGRAGLVWEGKRTPENAHHGGRNLDYCLFGLDWKRNGMEWRRVLC